MESTTLFNSLEKEFCPTLDSSLIAALLVEIESDGSGKSVTPNQDQIEHLRSTLRELSLQAEESQQSEYSDVQLTSQFDETISSWTTPDTNGPNTNGAGSSHSSVSSSQSFSSPLGFLQAALPDIPTTRLIQALEDAGDDVDMWDIVANIMTEESIREMEERGLDGLDEEEESYKAFGINDDWAIVDKKKKTPVKGPKKKSQPRPKKVALADVRQQHHVIQPPSQQNGPGAKYPPSGHVADPWTQISSLSDHLATLLPPHPPSVFQSFFHSPQYATSYDALRACLTSLSRGNQPSAESDDHVAVLYNLLDVIMPEYEVSDVEQRARLISDIELAVGVTQGKGDESLDLVNLLRELDSNSDLGIYHLQPSESTPKATNGPGNLSRTPSTKLPVPSAPPPVEPPPPWKIKQKSAPSTPKRNKPSPYQWQMVPQRKVPDRGPHHLAPYIPSYSREVNGVKTNRSKLNGSKGSNGNGLHPDSVEFRRRMTDTMRKRDEALKEAARMWQRGNSKSRGGEVAFYFAERARELQEVARQEALNAARGMVYEKRANSQDPNTIDLHGTTVAEALVIVREIVLNESTSINQGKPLKIVTGRGSHSQGQISVLKPAIRKALVEDGWVVGSWDAGLIVHHRRT